MRRTTALEQPGVRAWAPAAARWLPWLLVLAVVLRLVAALYLGDQIRGLAGAHDEISYDALAWRVVTGHGFSFAQNWWPATRAGEPTAHWSYLYTLYLAGCYALFGHHPLIPRLIQAVFAGLAGPALAFALGRRLFGRRAGLAAAGVTAVYAYFIFYGASLVTEGFFISAVMATLLFTLRAGEDPSPANWLRLGVALALAVLLRQVVLFVAPLLFAWIAWAATRARSPGPSPAGDRSGSAVHRFHVAQVLVPLAIVALAMLPFTVRNYLTFGRLVPLNTNAGYVLFYANHPRYGTDFVPILDSAEYAALIPPDLLGLDEAALEQALMRRAIGFMTADPLRILRLSVNRIGDYFVFWPLPGSGAINNGARLASFTLFLPFMVAGLWLSRARWPVCLPLYLFVAGYTLMHLVSWTLIRYRLPIDAVLIVFAGFSLSRLLWKKVEVD